MGKNSTVAGGSVWPIADAAAKDESPESPDFGGTQRRPQFWRIQPSHFSRNLASRLAELLTIWRKALLIGAAAGLILRDCRTGP